MTFWVSKSVQSTEPGAIIRDGDRKSWDARGPMIWDNCSIFRTNCAILTSYFRADPRTCRGLSRGCCHVMFAPCKVIQESLGFRIPRCGFRIPHSWIPDSISGWIPDLKIQFFLCTLFSQKKFVLFFCFSSSFALYKTILDLTREDCKYRLERFRSSLSPHR